MEPIVFGVIFLGITAFVVYRGINKGIEKFSRVLMPILLVMVVAIAIFSITIKGEQRTGLDGLKIYLIPDLSGKSFMDILTVVFDAVGQLFFSISVAMGILVTYGSYLKDDSDLVKSASQIEIFDTVVAFLAGVMIIPTVYVFLGREGMGMGDMRLLFATGLITGCYGLLILVYVSIFSAVIFAVPLLIRKVKRVSGEKKRIAEAEDPRAEKLKLQREKAAIHFAEDPDYMAFGPFLALGCAVFAIMEPFFFEKMYQTIILFGVYF